MSKKLKMPEKGLFGLPSPTRQINNEDNPSTQVLENPSTKELENPSTEVIKNLDTTISKNSGTEVSLELDNPSTQVPKNLSTIKPQDSDAQVLENPSTEQSKNSSTEELDNHDTQVPNIHSTKDSKNSSTQVLPKTKKNNRSKDEKKPVRKQASVHLPGSVLKALHMYAYEEGLEKSEVVEKALRKFIPKKFFL